MATVLITGASGFIGGHVIAELKAHGHSTVTLSRGDAPGADAQIKGDFSQVADLERLDSINFDVVIHLAGVTGAADEDEAIEINVAGTRRFLRYLLNRGIARYLIASSIAAVGCLSLGFVPRQLPISDSHPCDSENIYGVSKSMIEQLADYFARKDNSVELTLFRLGFVVPDETPAPTRMDVASMDLPFCDLGRIAVSDVARLFRMAVETPLGPGARTANVVAPVPWSPLPTADSIRLATGTKVPLDLHHYDDPNHRFDGVYDVRLVKHLYGFTAQIDLRKTPDARV